MQLPKEKGLKGKHRLTKNDLKNNNDLNNTTSKTKDQTTLTPL